MIWIPSHFWVLLILLLIKYFFTDVLIRNISYIEKKITTVFEYIFICTKKTWYKQISYYINNWMRLIQQYNPNWLLCSGIQNPTGLHPIIVIYGHCSSEWSFLLSDSSQCVQSVHCYYCRMQPTPKIYKRERMQNEYNHNRDNYPFLECERYIPALLIIWQTLNFSNFDHYLISRSLNPRSLSGRTQRICSLDSHIRIIVNYYSNKQNQNTFSRRCKCSSRQFCFTSSIIIIWLCGTIIINYLFYRKILNIKK